MTAAWAPCRTHVRRFRWAAAAVAVVVLVVFAWGDGRWRRTDEIHEAVRIAAGQAEDGTLADEPMERALETLSE